MNKKISYWIELSDYDLDTAEALLASGRYLYVGFMSHQAIEKILKAYFVSVKNETAPFLIVCHIWQRDPGSLRIFWKNR